MPSETDDLMRLNEDSRPYTVPSSVTLGVLPEHFRALSQIGICRIDIYYGANLTISIPT